MQNKNEFFYVGTLYLLQSINNFRLDFIVDKSDCYYYFIVSSFVNFFAILNLELVASNTTLITPQTVLLLRAHKIMYIICIMYYYTFKCVFINYRLCST